MIILDILPQGKAHSLPGRLNIKEERVFNLSKALADNPLSIKDFIFKTDFGIGLACFYYDPLDESCVKRLVAVLSVLVNDYHYLILDLPSSMDRNIFSILNQSDTIHLLSGPDDSDLKKTQALTQKLIDEFKFQKDKINIIINEYMIIP